MTSSILRIQKVQNGVALNGFEVSKKKFNNFLKFVLDFIIYALKRIEKRSRIIKKY